MNRVLVIGPTYQSELIYTRSPLGSDNAYNAKIDRFSCGGSYNIAYNLAVLDVDTHLVTRIGYDDIGNLMVLYFDKVNGLLHTCNHTLKSTPSKTYIIDAKNNLTTFDNLNFDCHPTSEDGLPTAVFQQGDYGVLEVINSNFLTNIITSYPLLKWISNNNIPTDKLLPYFEGITLDADYLKLIVDEANFPIYAQHLIEKGVKWVIITNRGLKATLYNMDGQSKFEKAKSGNYFVGSHEAFVAMLSACLSNEMSLPDAINHGLNLANDLTFVDDICLKKSFYE